jgi:hypothetical protein
MKFALLVKHEDCEAVISVFDGPTWAHAVKIKEYMEAISHRPLILRLATDEDVRANKLGGFVVIKGGVQ